MNPQPPPPPPPSSLATKKSGLFTGTDGKSLAITFLLVSTLFLLWGFCNGMIDVMDKHFQDKLHLTRSNSAWVQFAHYLGYFIISIPAGWLARKLGYKSGILTGLCIVVLGGLWFVPATFINTFPAFLFGVCLIAMGLTFLETIANPYATVLGPREYGATRINLAQSANGVGWIAGPVIGAMFFYNAKGGGAPVGAATGAVGKASFSIANVFSTIGAWFNGTVGPHQETLFIPYLGVACVVAVLVVVFLVAKIPNIKAADDYSDKGPETSEKFHFTSGGRKGLVIGLIIGVIGAFAIMGFSGDFAAARANGASGPGVFFSAIGNLFATGEFIGVVSTFMGAGFLCFIIGQYRSLPHVAGGVISQFLYVAAQAGIFSFFINYMVSDSPAVPEGMRNFLQPYFDFVASLSHGSTQGFINQPDGLYFFSDAGATLLLSFGFLLFLAGRVAGAILTGFVAPNKVFALFASVNIVLMVVIFAQLGWLSVVCVFMSFFFMSIMFPTIFALGIHGLGEKGKTASSFIVMAILGGAIMPKLMGWFSDHFGHVEGHYGRAIVAAGEHVNTNLMSPGFIVPLFCFVFLAAYGILWPKLAAVDGGGVQVNLNKTH